MLNQEIKEKVLELNRDDAVELLGYIAGVHKINVFVLEEESEE